MSQPSGRSLSRSEAEGLDTSRAERLFGFRAHMPFEPGLRRTTEWYQSALLPSPLDVLLQACFDA